MQESKKADKGRCVKNQVEITNQEIKLDDIRGKTLEERAKLILITLGRTEAEIKEAYRKMALKHHPDRQGDPGKFKLVCEAYNILMHGKMPKRKEASLLADDVLVIAFIHPIEKTVRKLFCDIKAEYYLGISDKKTFESQDPELSALYIVQGLKNYVHAYTEGLTPVVGPGFFTGK